ncbi:MAG: glycosyl hydrolase [Bryobacteraceae bacterium]|nr:glycosyl hydrolase [Bryobacteraceae bacterium]
MKRILWPLGVAIFLGFQAPQEDLEAGWRNPPMEARPHVYWLWLNGHVDVPAAKEELRAMKDAGLGGVLLFDMGARGDQNQQPPAGPEFLGEAWLKSFRDVVKEAKTLGLQVDFSVISSWDLGGAWTKPEHASMAIYAAEAPVEGGRNVEMELPYPPVPAGVPKGAEGKAAYWKNVSVLAVPSGRRKPGHDFVFHLAQTDSPTELRQVVLDPGDPGPSPTPVPMSPLRRFSVAVSEDGVAFREVLSGELKNEREAQSFALPPRTRGSWLRLRMIDAWDPGIPHWTLGEFQIVDSAGRNLAALRSGTNRGGGATLTEAPPAYSTGALWNRDNIHDGERVGPRGIYATGGPPPFDLVREGAVVLDRFVDSEGRLRWNAPAGQWTILRYVAMNTGERLKVASPKSDGWATDHLNPEATRAHLDYVIPRLRNTGVTNLYLPSYEVVGHIWSPGFLSEFRRLRGYDLTPYLPVVFGSSAGDREHTERVLFDYRKTMSDVLIGAYYRTALEQAAKAGFGIKSEAGGPGPPVHNVPVDSLLANANVSAVQGEFWPFRPDSDALWVVKETASAAHLYGKPRVHMEAFTSMHHWYEGPQDLKESADRAFCEGMNHVVWHTWTHVPGGSPKPGWVYLAGSHLNRNVTWWPLAKPFLAYLSRASYLLQQGRFVGDALYYYGDGGYKFVGPRRPPADLGPGYDYDAINSDAILNRLSIRGGRLALPDGTSYAALVLPDSEEMNPEVLARLESLVREGATVIGRPRRRAHGLSGYPDADARVTALANRLWSGLDGKSHTVQKYGSGSVVWGKTPRAVFNERNLAPDFEADPRFDFTHRRTDTTDIYFVRNTSRQPLSGEVLFRVSGRQPELWDPVGARIEDAPLWRQADGRTSVSLTLAPLGSTFVVFRRAASPPVQSPAPAADGPSLNIGGPWSLEFPSPMPAAEMTDLVSWTQLPLEAHKHFSGVVRYRTAFEVPRAWPLRTHATWLNLGRLWAIASVRLNGENLGVSWTEPFSMEVTRALRPGRNELEVEIVNTWHNRLVGDSKLPPSQRQTGTNVLASAGKAWKDWDLRDCGLFGPVTLSAQARR